jgi:pectate lyase
MNRGMNTRKYLWMVCGAMIGLPPLIACGSTINGSAPAAGPLLAFPGALGAGAYATGGRGGRVLRVTTLADAGPGSLRAALTASGPRIITFAVSGTIALVSRLTVEEGSFTVAGQTAPEGGITITGTRGMFDLWGADNFIIRYIRIRSRYPSAAGDEWDALQLVNCSNYIIDHVSASWGSDEIMTTRGSTGDVTWQRVLLAEGKTGTLFGDSNDPSLSGDLSFHHNAFYNVTHRHPNVHTDERADVYNNVVFNWRYRWSVVIGDMQLNHINNYYSRGCLEGVDGNNSLNKVFYRADYEPEIHSAGNLVVPDVLTDPEADNWHLWNWRMDVTAGPYAGATANTQLTRDYQVGTRFPLLGPPATVQSAHRAFDDVTSDVGANRRLDRNGDVLEAIDAFDSLYLANLRAGNCVPYVSSGAGADFDTTDHYAAFHASVSATPIATGYADTNDDGIPDAWAKAQGFGVTDDLTSHVFPSGYVGIEEFLNEVDR